MPFLSSDCFNPQDLVKFTSPYISLGYANIAMYVGVDGTVGVTEHVVRLLLG